MSEHRHRGLIDRLLVIREIEEKRLIGAEVADEFCKKEISEYLQQMKKQDPQPENISIKQEKQISK